MLFDKVPNELKERNQWVLWKLEQRQEGKKPTKVPYTVNNRLASSIDSTTWASFKDAYQAWMDSSEKFNGIGYMFSSDDPYTGVDLDEFSQKKVMPSEWVAWVNRFATYTEWSQSGKGLHLIVKASKPKGSRKRKGNVEVYDQERFFVVTGDHVEGTPLWIEERQRELDAFHDVFLVDNKERTSYSSISHFTSSLSPLTDDEILEKAKKAKNSQKFIRLFYEGDTGEYGSHSEADFALCGLLAFYSRDVHQVARLFMKSALDPHTRGKHAKVEQNDDYALRTATNAIKGTTEWWGDRNTKKPSDGLQMDGEGSDGDDWTNELIRNKHNIITNSITNFELIFKNDENLKDGFAFNAFSNRLEIVKKVPWTRVNKVKDIADRDEAALRTYIERTYGIHSRQKVNDVLVVTAAENKYHPVRDYLKGLEWDGVPRLDTLLIDYMGASDTELVRMQSRLIFIGAIKRIFHPGCKFDYVLTLKGDQGLGKSSFWKTLAVEEEWFSDSLEDMRGKEAKEHLHGVWIIELGEMAAVGRGDQKRIKQFITSTHDRYRASYGKFSESHPRQCIFVATTNEDEPLKDDTGNRRWWMVEVDKAWFDREKELGRSLKKEVPQIWAEAIHRYL